jgi:general secretion pathway protein H
MSDGYTLTEMLAVLGILALVLSVSLPTTMRRPAAQVLESHASMVMALLKAARLSAIRRNSEATFEADLVQRSFSATGSGQPLRLGSEVSVRMLTAREEVLHGMASIRFFPDGTSTGGAIELAQGSRSIEVRVNWLTGRISRNNTK